MFCRVNAELPGRADQTAPQGDRLVLATAHPPGQQALLLPVHLRKSETFAEFSAGFEVSISTAWRYVEEAVALLSARSPKLTRALRKATKDGLHQLVLDGTRIACDRVRADPPYYSAKHRCHGMNIQVIAGPDGTIL